MTAIKKLLAGVLLLSGMVTASAQTSQTPVKKSDFLRDAKAGNVYTNNNLFLIKIADDFFPEKFGANRTPSNSGSATSVDESYFKNEAGFDAFNANGDKTYSEYIFEKSVGDVVELHPATTTSNDLVRNKKGKLYGYNGELSRFLYVQRTNYAYQRQEDELVKWNPYKVYKPDNEPTPTGFNFLSYDNRFIEYSISANDVKNGTTVVDGTKEWENAYNSGSSMIATLQDGFTYDANGNLTGYGLYPISHDCVNATMRSHFMHMNPQTNVTDITPYTRTETTKDYHYDTWTYNSRTRTWSPKYNQGHYNSDGCVSTDGTKTVTSGSHSKTYDNLYKEISTTVEAWDFSKFSAAKVASTTGEVFLLFVPDFPTTSTDFMASNNNVIYNDYRPYIQLYKGLIWYSRDCAPEEGSTQESNLLANGWQHDIKWVDTAMDKFLNGGEVYTVERRRINNDGTAGEWEVIESEITSREKTKMVYARERKDYWYEYRVKCTIKSIGLSVYTNTPKLIVPGNSLDDVELTVSSYSNAVDENEATKGYGVNNIKHTLNITTTNDVLKKVEEGAGVFFVKHNGKTILTLTGTGKKGQYTGSDGKSYTFVDGKLICYNNVSYNYNVDGTGLDKYQISFKNSADSEDSKSTDEKIAPFYRTTFTVAAVNNQTLSDGNYFYADKIEWVVTKYSIEEYIANSVENGKFSLSCNYMNNNIPDGTTAVNKLTGIESTETTHTNTYVGYIKFPETGDNVFGTWGLGYGTAYHEAGKVSGGSLNTKSYPHNRVLTVKQEYSNHDALATNPMWNNPISCVGLQDLETEQIFPGTDIDITIDEIKTGKGTDEVFTAICAVVIYDLDPAMWGENKSGRLTPEGTQYYQEVASTTQLTNGVKIPTLENGADMIQNLPTTYQKNVIYNFNNKETEYSYDAFVFYLPEGSTTVTSYAHSGYDLISNESPYDSYEYAKKLPRVAREKVLHETNIKPFSGSDVKAGSLNIGGFSYMVVDMTKAIPTKNEIPTKVKDSRTEYDQINSAVTRYKITAKQGENNLEMFTPYVDEESDIHSETTPFAGMDYNSTNPGSLYVYPTKLEKTENEETSYVDGFTQTVQDRTEDHGKMQISSDKNYVLVGARGVSIPNKAPAKSPRKAQTNVVNDKDPNVTEKVLTTPITLKVEPMYTISDPEIPIMGLDESANAPRIIYRSDVFNSVKNAIPLHRFHVKPNSTATVDYKTQDVGEEALNESGDVNYLESGVVSGIEGVEIGDVKVYAEGLTIVVEGEAELVVVFDASAKQVYAGTEHRIEVAQPGVYVVATGGKIYKVFVK